MFSEQIFAEPNGRLIDLQNVAAQDSAIALLAAALSDNTRQNDLEVYSWLKLLSTYQNQNREVQYILDYSSTHMLQTFKKQYIQGFVAHLIFVMAWAVKSNNFNDAGVSKAYYLTQKILAENYKKTLSQKTIKNYYQSQEHVVHIWVAIFSYPNTQQIAQSLLREHQKELELKQELDIVIENLRLLMTPRFTHDSASYYFYGTDFELPRTKKNTEPLYLVDRVKARAVSGVDIYKPSKLEINDELNKLCENYTRVNIE